MDTYGRIDIHADAPVGIRTALITANLCTAAEKGDNVNLVTLLSECYDSNVMDAKRRGDEASMAEQYALDQCEAAVQHLLEGQRCTLDAFREGIREFRDLANEARAEKESSPEGVLRMIFPSAVLDRMDTLEGIIDGIDAFHASLR